MRDLVQQRLLLRLGQPARPRLPWRARARGSGALTALRCAKRRLDGIAPSELEETRVSACGRGEAARVRTFFSVVAVNIDVRLPRGDAVLLALSCAELSPEVDGETGSAAAGIGRCAEPASGEAEPAPFACPVIVANNLQVRVDLRQIYKLTSSKRSKHAISHCGCLRERS